MADSYGSGNHQAKPLVQRLLNAQGPFSIDAYPALCGLQHLYYSNDDYQRYYRQCDEDSEVFTHCKDCKWCTGMPAQAADVFQLTPFLRTKLKRSPKKCSCNKTNTLEFDSCFNTVRWMYAWPPTPTCEPIFINTNKENQLLIETQPQGYLLPQAKATGLSRELPCAPATERQVIAQLDYARGCSQL